MAPSEATTSPGSLVAVSNLMINQPKLGDIFQVHAESTNYISARLKKIAADIEDVVIAVSIKLTPEETALLEATVRNCIW